MPALPAKPPLKVFCSYSHKDEAALKELRNHLSGLRGQGLIDDWHDRNIKAGDDWSAEIERELEAADLILLLISSNFLASHYCINVETARALEREQEDSATVIPIFWRKCDIAGQAFEYLQGVPNDVRWVSLQDDRDSAWTEVAEGIRHLITPSTPLPLLSMGSNSRISHPLALSGREARGVRVLLAALFCLIAASAVWYYWQQHNQKHPLKTYETLLQQGEYQSAKQHCAQQPVSPDKERCLRIANLMLEHRNVEQFYAAAENDPDQAYALTIMGEAKAAQEDYANAREYYQRAIELNPDIAQAYFGLGQLLHQQGFINHAWPWYEKAVKRAPNNRRFLHNLAANYVELGELKKAEEQYRALLKTDDSQLLAYGELVEVLQQRGKEDEAQVVAQQARQGIAQNPDWKDKPLNAQTWFVLRDSQAVYLQSWEDKQRWLDSVFAIE